MLHGKGKDAALCSGSSNNSNSPIYPHKQNDKDSGGKGQEAVNKTKTNRELGKKNVTYLPYFP